MAHMVGHSMMGAEGGSRKPTQAPVASRSTKPEAGQAIEASLLKKSTAKPLFLVLHEVAMITY